MTLIEDLDECAAHFEEVGTYNSDSPTEDGRRVGRLQRFRAARLRAAAERLREALEHTAQLHRDNPQSMVYGAMLGALVSINEPLKPNGGGPLRDSEPAK